MNDDRKYIVRALILLIGFIFAIKLFAIQILDDNYRLAAENNILQEIIEYPYRGLIFDRNDELLVYNSPIYDIMVVPREVNVRDTLRFCEMLDITKEEFVKKLNRARKYHRIKPSQFVKQIPNDVFAQIQDRLIEYPGFYPKARTVRKYPNSGLANVYGYIGEVSSNYLRRDTSNYYRSGDFLGITGLESYYEEQLRGKRGVKFKMVNVSGVEKGSFKEGSMDTLAVPGENLRLSIDLKLQEYAERLMKNKIGSVVAIEPSSGEILGFVSSPSYNPNQLSGRDFSDNYGELSTDSLKPLFNRPLMAMYPPGSIFKIIQGLIALEEGVIGAKEQVYCDGTLIGDHARPGYYDMHKGIMYSSNNYFYKVFRRIINRDLEASPFKEAPRGLANWKKQVMRFGLGRPLDVDLPNERAGLVPGPETYNSVYGPGRWKFSNISSLSIGQGELLMNPIQMANLAAIMANKGFYYRPHIIKGIGSTNYLDSDYKTKIETGISAEHFPPIVDGMRDALYGTAPRAVIPGITICGKTGTVENPHGEDHSVFMAFGPKDDPKIAIAVFVENAGWGGRAAGSIASLIIEKYLRDETQRPWLEAYVDKGNFGD